MQIGVARLVASMRTKNMVLLGLPSAFTNLVRTPMLQAAWLL
jgi:hypothetical protein